MELRLKDFFKLWSLHCSCISKCHAAAAACLRCWIHCEIYSAISSLARSMQSNSHRMSYSNDNSKPIIGPITSKNATVNISCQEYCNWLISDDAKLRHHRNEFTQLANNGDRMNYLLAAVPLWRLFWGKWLRPSFFPILSLFWDHISYLQRSSP